MMLTFRVLYLNFTSGRHLGIHGLAQRDHELKGRLTICCNPGDGVHGGRVSVAVGN
jgi:hypothetical protein